jgi:hypothetical protein
MIYDAPHCARLQLGAVKENDRVQLVNKEYGMPLCVDEEQRVYCCKSWDRDDFLCIIRVDPDTALARFSYQLEPGNWINLDAMNNKGTVSKTGAQWMIKVLDDDHVKIFSRDGK